MSTIARFQVAMFALSLAATVSVACSGGDPGVGIGPRVGPQTGGLDAGSDASSSAPGDDSGFNDIPDASADTAVAHEAGDAAPDAPSGPIVSFSLIDTSITNIVQGSPVAGFDPIANGSTFSLAQVGNQLSIRANINAPVGSIGFVYDQTTHTENATPYMLCGDNGQGTIQNCNLQPGTHRLTATPYSDANLGGTAGAALSIDFTITQ